MSTASQVVILGAGHAGGSLAAMLRQQGHTGAIVMIGDEPIAPYQRPPLSKAWLKGEADAESLALRPLGFYAENQIDFRPSTRAVSIHRPSRSVRLEPGEALTYDTLVIATGARATPLPIAGANLEGVLTLRTAADAEALSRELGPGRQLAIIGGGYIGLEVAASARALGAEAMIIERELRLLARSAAPTLSDFFKSYHEARGVSFELGVVATALDGRSGRVTAVRLADGRTLPCDTVLVSVGALPNEEMGRASGLECDRGIVVDFDARTSDPSVFAIGDVTTRPSPLYEHMFRAESVPSALEQAKQAAAAICGKPRPPAEVPWNWSDQFDLKLQIAGMPIGADQMVVRGEPRSARFAIFHVRDGSVRAVEAINAPAEFMMGRQLIQNRGRVDLAKLADPSVSMKDVLA